MTDVVQYKGTHGSTPRGSENTQDSPGHPLAGRFLLLGDLFSVGHDAGASSGEGGTGDLPDNDGA